MKEISQILSFFKSKRKREEYLYSSLNKRNEMSSLERIAIEIFKHYIDHISDIKVRDGWIIFEMLSTSDFSPDCIISYVEDTYKDVKISGYKKQE